MKIFQRRFQYEMLRIIYHFDVELKFEGIVQFVRLSLSLSLWLRVVKGLNLANRKITTPDRSSASAIKPRIIIRFLLVSSLVVVPRAFIIHKTTRVLFLSIVKRPVYSLIYTHKSYKLYKRRSFLIRLSNPREFSETCSTFEHLFVRYLLDHFLLDSSEDNRDRRIVGGISLSLDSIYTGLLHTVVITRGR